VTAMGFTSDNEHLIKRLQLASKKVQSKMLAQDVFDIK